MATVKWRKKALDDLDRLDQWREDELGLPPIAPAILIMAEEYFNLVDLQSHLPGTPVVIGGERSEMRLLLLRVGRSEPYKVFFRILMTDNACEVRRVRHPRQRPLGR